MRETPLKVYCNLKPPPKLRTIFATRGNCTASLSVVTVPACFSEILWHLFLGFCFISFISSVHYLVLKGRKLLDFSILGFLFYVKLASRDLFSIFGIVHEVFGSSRNKQFLPPSWSGFTVFPSLFSEYTTLTTSRTVLWKCFKEH